MRSIAIADVLAKAKAENNGAECQQFIDTYIIENLKSHFSKAKQKRPDDNNLIREYGEYQKIFGESFAVKEFDTINMHKTT